MTVADSEASRAFASMAPTVPQVVFRANESARPNQLSVSLGSSAVRTSRFIIAVGANDLCRHMW